MNWRCYNCGTVKSVKQIEAAKHFPIDPCPVTCGQCGAYCCPNCGGEMGGMTGNEDMDEYTAGQCQRTGCAHHCCGECI